MLRVYLEFASLYMFVVLFFIIYIISILSMHKKLATYSGRSFTLNFESIDLQLVLCIINVEFSNIERPLNCKVVRWTLFSPNPVPT